MVLDHVEASYYSAGALKLLLKMDRDKAESVMKGLLRDEGKIREHRMVRIIEVLGEVGAAVLP